MRQYGHSDVEGGHIRKNTDFTKQQSQKVQDEKYCSCTEFIKRVSGYTQRHNDRGYGVREWATHKNKPRTTKTKSFDAGSKLNKDV